MLNPFKKIKFSHASFTPSIKPTISIVTLYERLIGPIKKHTYGSYMLVLCPSHGEKHPSCALYPKTNSLFCFSCGYTADIYKLVMDNQHITFKEACEFIKSL